MIWGAYLSNTRYPATPSDDDSGKLVTEIPISVALTEFHFVLLYKDRVRAICQLNDQIVYEEMIPMVNPVPRAKCDMTKQLLIGA